MTYTLEWDWRKMCARLWFCPIGGFRCHYWAPSSCKSTGSYDWHTWPWVQWQWATPGRMEMRTGLRYEIWLHYEATLVFLGWQQSDKLSWLIRGKGIIGKAKIFVIIKHNFPCGRVFQWGLKIKRHDKQISPYLQKSAVATKGRPQSCVIIKSTIYNILI